VKTLELNDLQTLVTALAALLFANELNAARCRGRKLNVPSPVVGGVAVAIGIALIRTWFDAEILFASHLTDFLLLYVLHHGGAVGEAVGAERRAQAL
jgi:sodium--glutamate symport carrier gltS